MILVSLFLFTFTSCQIPVYTSFKLTLIYIPQVPRLSYHNVGESMFTKAKSYMINSILTIDDHQPYIRQSTR
jgi:hypothetical protein